MPAKNDHSEPRPVTTALDETSKKRTVKSSAKPPAKASARTKTASKSAASEATGTAAPKPRRKAAIAVNADDTSAVGNSRDVIAFVEDEVRVRAYMLSLARGDRPGTPDSDWYQAEREVALSRQP